MKEILSIAKDILAILGAIGYEAILLIAAAFLLYAVWELL
jgi:hypothetical protein